MKKLLGYFLGAILLFTLAAPAATLAAAGAVAVPEPATLILVVAGLLGIGVFGRKRFKK